MRAEIGLMVEGQNELNWQNWEQILHAAERGGYQCVFRSDHYVNPGPPDYDSLELWVSLTYAAQVTERIEFGPLVTPVTFRHPTMTLRYASAVDDLSGGRLVLGLGAGWQDREHHNYGLPFPAVPTRFAMFTEQLEFSTRILDDPAPLDYEGDHYQLREAVLLPRPRRRMPILIGGNGPRRTLPLAARFGQEWNGVYLNIGKYRERQQQLDALLAAAGRSPSEVKRSLMAGFRWAKDRTTLDAQLKTASEESGREVTLEYLRGSGLFVGTSEMIIAQLEEFVAAGCQRFMLQVTDNDDLEPIAILAEEILPHFHNA